MKKNVVVSLLFALILLLAACGGNKDEADGGTNTNDKPTGSGENIELKASNWSFDQDSYTVPAGEVTVHLKNEEGFHGIQIEGTDINIEGDGSATATLEPGEYKISCSIICGTGHHEMTATLIVE